MKHKIEYFFMRALLLVFRLLPFSFVIRLGGLSGIFAYRFIPVRKKVALINIRAAFPDKSNKEISRICRDSYKYIGMTFFEYFVLHRLSPEKILSMVEFDPPDLLKNMMEENKGVIAVTGHFGSFELMATAARASGFLIDVVVKALKNPGAEAILEQLRNKCGLGVIKTKDGFAKVSESIENKRIIALVADQDAGSKGVPVDFFGIKSSTYAGTAVLGIRTGAPMVAVFIVRKSPVKFVVKLHPVSYDDLNGSMEDKVKELTLRHTSILESYIREYPDHYFWMHKRWKSAGLYDKQPDTMN